MKKNGKENERKLELKFRENVMQLPMKLSAEKLFILSILTRMFIDITHYTTEMLALTQTIKEDK